ncbi:MAG: hypothetical protein GY941_22670 [Planctomycetes bacterium]|nr:hypothetical protein [Planctomycetota bacterium]
MNDKNENWSESTNFGSHIFFKGKSKGVNTSKGGSSSRVTTDTIGKSETTGESTSVSISKDGRKTIHRSSSSISPDSKSWSKSETWHKNEEDKTSEK